VEAAGIEPTDDFDLTALATCDCENCEEWRAAYAQHFKQAIDISLLQIIDGWPKLPESIRRAIVALVDAAK
jgi:hypothetical protein